MDTVMNSFEPSTFTASVAMLGQAVTLKQIATDEFGNMATCTFQAIIQGNLESGCDRGFDTIDHTF